VIAMDDEKGCKNPICQLMGCAALCAVGITLMMLGCAIYKEWLALTTMIPFIFSLIPLLLCGLTKPADSMSSSSTEGWLDHLAQFIVGVSSLSAPALLLVLWHTDQIVWQCVLFFFAAFIVLALAIALLLVVLFKRQESFF